MAHSLPLSSTSQFQVFFWDILIILLCVAPLIAECLHVPYTSYHAGYEYSFRVHRHTIFSSPSFSSLKISSTSNHVVPIVPYLTHHNLNLTNILFSTPPKEIELLFSSLLPQPPNVIVYEVNQVDYGYPEHGCLHRHMYVVFLVV
jgi:hypothetical protein